VDSNWSRVAGESLGKSPLADCTLRIIAWCVSHQCISYHIL
jgi:hypothetical protein